MCRNKNGFGEAGRVALDECRVAVAHVDFEDLPTAEQQVEIAISVEVGKGGRSGVVHGIDRGAGDLGENIVAAV
jgi:hypothetical protein